MADTAKKNTGEVYYVENTVRKVGARFHRALSATRHRFKLFIAGQRLIRGQKVALTPAQFQQEEEKIHKMVMAGQVALHLPDGMRITSTHTGDVIYTRPDGAVKLVKKDEAPPKAAAKKPPVETPTKLERPMEPMLSAPAEAPTAREPEDLTVLPGIGAGRARKLEASGVSNYYQVVEQGSASLVELLGVTDEVAAEIVAKATELS